MRICIVCKRTLVCTRSHARVHPYVLVTRNVCSVSERGVGRLVSTREGTANADSRTFETYYSSLRDLLVRYPVVTVTAG